MTGICDFLFWERRKMPDCWSVDEHWSDHSAVNLPSAGKSDTSDEDCDVKQSINLNDHFVLDHLYMFTSMQLEIKSDSENAH